MRSEAAKNGPNVAIRPGRAADAAMLARFRYAFRTRNREAHEEESAFLQRCTAWMQERLHENSLWNCWIAEEGQLPVGHIWIQLVEKIPNPGTETELHAYLTNFYVLGPYRGRGIGSRLLLTALECCKERRVHAVILWPSDESRSLYLRHGFAVRDDLLELLLT